MKKQRMKVKLIKSRIKIIEPTKKKPVFVTGKSVNEQTDQSSLESKTTSAALPLIKQEPKTGQARQQAVRTQQPRQPGQAAATGENDERIFVSYDRFQMNESEKRKAYTLDIRGSAASKQTATIERGTPQNPLLASNQNEIRHRERSGDALRAIDLHEPSLAEDEARSKYTEAPNAKYKTKRQTDFY